MKLRNKKTGDIWEFDEGFAMKASYETAKRAGAISGSLTCYANSIAEINEEWEDYKPAEPLIKDEKIRKAVRAWAEVNELEPDFEVKYSENTFALISWQASIDFNTQIKGLGHNKKYTITELCGEEEE